MDANIITTVATGIGILGGAYAIIKRSEDRIISRMADHFKALTARFEEKAK